MLGQQYVVSTVAGNLPQTTTPVVATTISLAPFALNTDSAGYVYFSNGSSVSRMDRNGIATLLAGTGRPGFAGDGGAAANAQLNTPANIAIDGSGNTFIADAGNHRIRRITVDGIIATVVGSGSVGYSGDGGSATNAQLTNPESVTFDASGNLFFVDVYNGCVRKVSPNGIITTVAGTGTLGYSGDGGPALKAQLSQSFAVVVDGAGDLFIADTYNQRIRKVSPSGVITTVAGDGTAGYSGDGGPAANAQLNYPWGLALDGSGDLFVADSSNNRVRMISPNGNISTVAGTGTAGFFGDGSPAIGAELNRPAWVAVDNSANLFIADFNNKRIRQVSVSGTITTAAGNGASVFTGDQWPTTSAQFGSVLGIAVDGAENIFVADHDNNRVRKISTSGVITTVAGNGTPGFSGDGGLATSAQLSGPRGVAVDGAGNLFIADSANARIREVSTAGVISTVAGGGNASFLNTVGNPATGMSLRIPSGVAADGAGNIYVADSSTNITWGISASRDVSWLVQIVGSLAGIAVDRPGNIYASAADSNSSYIAQILPPSGYSFVAGKPHGLTGFYGDGGPAVSAELNFPEGVATDSAGNLLIADTDNNRIRKVSAGIISTIAGDSAVGAYSGDGGPATSAELYYPSGVAVGASGNVYIADAGNNAIRKLTATSQAIAINAVLDAASESAVPISAGKIVAIFGYGLGPANGVIASPANGAFATQLSGTTVSVNGIPAPIYYTSATQVNAIVPYAVSGTAAAIMVSYNGGVSSSFSVSVAASSPGFFSYNGSGTGQAAAINVVDGTLNTAANPVKIGGYISFYATGEGQTNPAGVDGKLAALPLPAPSLPVTITVGGIPAVVQYYGGVYGVVAGLMQVNVQIPAGVIPGGYVPVVLKVGTATTVNGAVWIAVSN